MEAEAAPSCRETSVVALGRVPFPFPLPLPLRLPMPVFLSLPVIPLFLRFYLPR